MRTLFFALLAVIGFTFAACSQQPAATANTGQVKFKTSAHCGACKKTIEGALTKVAGVNQADLNLDDKVATVKYDPATTNPEQLKTTIEGVGYTAEVVN